MLVCPPSDTDDNWLMDEGDEDDDDEEEDEGKNFRSYRIWLQFYWLPF